MKKLGLIGGISPESTLLYYKIINEQINHDLGMHNTAKIFLESVNFQDIVQAIFSSDWERTSKILCEAAVNIEKAGADVLLICSNTLHKVFPAVESSVKIPMINILDIVAEKIKEDKFKKVGLLGTVFTMEDDFHVRYFKEKHDIDMIVPSKEDRNTVNEIIFDELCKGIVSQKSRLKLLKIIDHLDIVGVDGIVLGCTELPLILSSDDHYLPLYDTTNLHAHAAVKFLLNN